MEEMVKLTLAASIPLWVAVAVFAFVSAYYGGVAGLGIVFITIIIVAVFWNRTLVSFSDRVYGHGQRESGQGYSELRLRDIESKLDDISRRMKE